MGFLTRIAETVGLRPRASDTSYEAASRSDRALSSWNPVATSPDAEIIPEMETLLGRGRDLVRNNGVAAGAMQTLTDNIVGTGLRLSAMPDYRRLGRDKAWAEEWSNLVESLFREWADTSNCDAARALNFAGMTAQVARAYFLNGEGLAVAKWLPNRDRPYATCIQVIEADRLSNPYGRVDSDTLRGGVEVDENGAALAYHIRNGHPGDVVWTPVRANTWTRVEAFTYWGRQQVIHVHDRERAGQTRGKTALAAVLKQFKMADHYSQAELKAAVVNAMVAMTVEAAASPTEVADMFGGTEEYLAARGEHSVKLQPGAVLPLFPGDKATPFIPSRPAAQFDQFTKAMLRHIGVGLNLPYELLLKDFSQTNYSSARAAMLEAWRYFNGRRQWLATYWATPVYALWLEEAVNAGRLGIEPREFYRNRYAFTRCRWIGPGRGWVDPVKEAQAATIRMGAGLTTLEYEAAEQGRDWREDAEQRATEAAELRRLGLPVPWEVNRPPPQAGATNNAAEDGGDNAAGATDA